MCRDGHLVNAFLSGVERVAIRSRVSLVTWSQRGVCVHLAGNQLRCSLLSGSSRVPALSLNTTCLSPVGVPAADAARGDRPRVDAARVHAVQAHHAAARVRTRLLRRAARRGDASPERTRATAAVQLHPAGYVCVCVRACVCEREREGVCVCVCVCVCVRVSFGCLYVKYAWRWCVCARVCQGGAGVQGAW